MHLKIETIDDNATWSVHPTYSNAVINKDTGLDIPMPQSVVIEGNSMGTTVKLGIKCEPDHAYMLFPRSSIGKTPIRLANSIGLIDVGYRGELMAKVDNVSDDDFILEGGKCYFQIVSFDGILPTYEVVKSLTDTSRGSGGFGSTTEPLINYDKNSCKISYPSVLDPELSFDAVSLSANRAI